MKNQACKTDTVDAYLFDFPEDIRHLLQKVRSCIIEVVPEASEAIKYGIPTYVYHKQNLVHFGGYRKHIGFYPTPKVLMHFERQIVEYKSSKGAVQFPLDRPIPLELIAEMTLYRKTQVDAG